MFRVDKFIASSKSWSDFFSKTKELPKNKLKGDVFERFVQVYLETNPIYASKFKDVWLLKQVPNTIKKKLNLPDEDFGIDLIAKTYKNQFYSIQAKFRSSVESSLTYKELATFHSLSFKNCKHIEHGHIFHTSSRKIANKKYLKDTSDIGIAEWLQIDAEQWSRIQSATKEKLKPLKKRKPFPHQKKIIKKAKAYFKENNRGKMIMPCGTGKSLTAFWIAQELASKNIIVAVPSLSLIKQSINDWTKEYMAMDIVPDWICVCSDESTGKIDTDSFESEVYDLGIKTTTDKKELNDFLKKRTSKPKIIFTTYQSSPILAKAAKAAKTEFDLGIFDEAHKTVGNKFKTFATMLDERKIKIKKRLFMTATERVFRGSDDEVLSMDNEKIYGQRFYQMSFKEAIELDIISDYRVATMTISDDALLELIEENSFLSDRKKNISEIEASKLAAGISLKKAFKKYGIKHAISFHRSIESAKDFRKQQDKLNDLKNIGPKITNSHISSKKTAGQRARLMQEFSDNKKALMTNARCLTEGIDVPTIDAVLFADPKQSVIDIVQAAGRALRKHEKKKYGYILLPIVIPANQSFEEYSEKTSFKNIARIIAALSAQDERIAEEFRLINSGKKTRGKIIDIDIDIKGSKKVNLQSLSNEINTKLWAKVGKTCYRDFNEARKFVNSLGLKSRSEWWDYKKKNFLPDIPIYPNEVYEEFTTMGDFLGTGYVANRLRNYKSFKEAKLYVKKLNLNTSSWRDYAKSDEKPLDIPADPANVYKNQGWKSYPDFLGTNPRDIKKRRWREFEAARRYIRTLNFKNETEWRNFDKSRLPIDIPSAPRRVYENDWISFPDFIGTNPRNAKNLKYRTYKEAKKYVQKLNLKSFSEYKKYYQENKLPLDIPMNPRKIYEKKGWKGNGDYLGTGYVANRFRNYKSFNEAKSFVQKLGLKTATEWRAFTKSKNFPKDIPVAIDHVYKDQGFISLPDFLGSNAYNAKRRKFLSYGEAKNYVNNLQLKSAKDWRLYCSSGKRPLDIPALPEKYYKNKGWKNYQDWLGKK